MSTPEYLLDTNICIYVAKHNPPSVRRRFLKLEADALAMSLVTWGELQFGAQRSQSKAKAIQSLEILRENIQVLPMSPEVGSHYGDIRATLQSKGLIIGNNDLWIAAHARSLGLTLVTHNTREFKRVKDLTVEDWV